MKYTSGWIAKNMGISKDTLDLYEKNKYVIPNRNPINDYREYTYEQLESIWIIKLLISIGITHQDLKNAIKTSNDDFSNQMEKCIQRLENKVNEYTSLLGHARIIKATGMMPGVPKEMGSIKFSDYLQLGIEKINANNDEEAKLLCGILNKLDNETISRYSEKIVEMIGIEKSMTLFAIDVERKKLIIEVLKNMWKGYNHEDVQSKIEDLYDYDRENFNNDLSKGFYGKYTAAQFVGSDVAYFALESFGKENCEFLYDALMYYSEINS